MNISPVFTRVFLLVFSMLLFGFVKEKVQRKIIRDKEFDTHCYVLKDEVEVEKDRMYYWYLSGEIHQSIGASGGRLLHDEYTKYYRGNQLAEKGEFKKGLKNGVWKKWYKNGNVEEEVKWSNGRKNGACLYYNDAGILITKGSFNKNRKKGIWIDLVNKDTTWYKEGVAHKEPPRVIKKRNDSIAGKQPFVKRVLKPFKKLFNKKEEGLEKVSAKKKKKTRKKKE